MAIENLTLAQYVTTIVSKTVGGETKKTYEKMAIIMDEIGLEAYTMNPSEIIDRHLESCKKYKKDKAPYSEMQWLDFVSNEMISRFFRGVILKQNHILYRRMLAETAKVDNDGKSLMSSSKIQTMKFLKQVIDESVEEVDSNLQHYSQFIPLRRNDDVKYDDETENELKKTFVDALDYLEIDTDYTKVFDTTLAEKKEADFRKGLILQKGLAEKKKTKEEIRKAKKQKLLDKIIKIRENK